jgi:(p)ppGpp synthase/HD superfamily hydrolase
MNTQEVANNIEKSIAQIRKAHMEFSKTELDRVRFHDNSTPYIVHPIFCAMAILSEPALDEHIRLIGYQALLFHDVLEDTTAALPEKMDPEVIELVQLMSFENFRVECNDVWTRPPLIRLLKLYDKTSNLLDGSHMSDTKWNLYVEFVMALIADVESHFGQLNIVRIAKAIAIPRQAC